MQAAQTPLVKQYLEIKKDFQDAILFFRLGDFYEMFFEDAKIAAGVLHITLTTRDKRSENPVPLCGVPYHSADQYISKLLDHGFKVAICEQVEDPKEAKGIVRREVVRVVTPALRTDQEGLRPKDQTVLVSIAKAEGQYALAWIDVSSLRFEVCASDRFSEIANEFARLPVRELLVAQDASDEIQRAASALGDPNLRVETRPSAVYHDACAKLARRFSLSGISGLGFSAPEAMARACMAVVEYVEIANRSPMPQLAAPKSYHWADCLYMDAATRNHLELFPAGRLDESHTLMGVLDRTTTSMGSRKLREWLQFPLKRRDRIEARLDAVEELSQTPAVLDALRDELAKVYDLERLTARLMGSRANARDLVALRESLEAALRFKRAAAPLQSPLLRDLAARLVVDAAWMDRLHATFVDQPPLSTQEGGMIRDGVHPELDGFRDAQRGGKDWLLALETSERKRTEIPNLKVGYNRVFGYFIEITKSYLSKVPEDYERRQTLTNAERFVTPGLKDHEAKILGAQEKVSQIESGIFHEARREAVARESEIRAIAGVLSEIDVLVGFARAAIQWDYVRPTLRDGFDLHLVDARHPVVERHLSEPFVSNSIALTREKPMIVLTGPNMAGKSTIMRQMALIVLMAHVGCFVPAKSAEVPLVDRVFTRVGASDDLAGGRSTFMVEMNETANILRNATENSLVVLDEIGRGTSTFDGLAIAWAVAEDLVDRIGCKTIFATHYHELTRLAETKAKVRNMNVAVREWDGEIIFMRSLAEGAVNRSYGIEVARLAGVLPSVIERARAILPELERANLRNAPEQLSLAVAQKADEPIREELLSLDLGHVTPVQALLTLQAWQQRYKSG